MESNPYQSPQSVEGTERASSLFSPATLASYFAAVCSASSLGCLAWLLSGAPKRNDSTPEWAVLMITLAVVGAVTGVAILFETRRTRLSPRILGSATFASLVGIGIMGFIVASMAYRF